MENEDIPDIASLTQQGLVELDGIDESGEAIYKFDLVKLKDSYSSIYNRIMEEMNEDLLILFENNILDVEYDEDLNAKFKINERGEEILKQKGFFQPPLSE